MGFLAFFSYSAQSVDISAADNEKEVETAQDPAGSRPLEGEPGHVSTPELSVDAKDVPLPTSPTPGSPKLTKKLPSRRKSSPTPTKPTPAAADAPAPEIKTRRFSFRAFSLTRPHDHKPALSNLEEHDRKTYAAAAAAKRSVRHRPTSSEKRAKESALVLRALIIGPSTASPQLTTANAKPQLNKIKSELIKPKSANKVIAQLRALPISDEVAGGKGQKGGEHLAKAQGPIHAVCLEHPDAEEHQIHFAPLFEGSGVSEQAFGFPNTSSISIDQMTAVFNRMNIVNLISSPDFGLGQPGDGEGLLSGAVPTAETVLKGIQQITPQLMALGYATGRAILPDHAGIHPPTDRMSVLTYWWGLELVLPPPSLEYLASAQSISGTVVNFLSALSLVNNGVREILPFVRYIAQFIDFEFNTIRAQDKGNGVVCAATWIMPAAMVPRAWDFPDPPEETQPEAPKEKPGKVPDSTLPSQLVTSPETTPLPPSMPVPMPSFADVVIRTYADSVTFHGVASPPLAEVQ